jgi:hypothetical protein
MSKSATPNRTVHPPVTHSITPTISPGQIVHAAWGMGIQLNAFAVVVKETSKTAILAPLAARRKHESPGRGYERPILRNGQLAIKNLVAISRIRGPEDDSALIAHIRLDPRFFNPIASSDARAFVSNPRLDETFVEVFRVYKVLADDGGVLLPYRKAIAPTQFGMAE